MSGNRRLLGWLGLVLGGAVGCAACGGAATSTAATSTGTAQKAATVSSAAAGPVHATVGAFHVDTEHFRMDSDAGTEVVVAQVLLHPGASNGWHEHPGPGFVVVTAGSLTRYEVGADGTCVHTTYGAGQGFVELPDSVHLARNDGSTDVTAVATFVDVPAGTTAYKTAEAAPAACAGIR